MKNKKMTTIFVVGITFMLTLTLGISYAYFSKVVAPINVSIGNNTTLLSMDLNATNTIEFNINPYMPLSDDVLGESDEVSTTVNFTNNDTNLTTCNYEIVYIPDRNTATFVQSPDNTDNLQELVIVGTNRLHQNSDFSFSLANKPYTNEDGYKIMDASIWSSNGVTVAEQWKFKVVYYNYDFDQSINAGKNIKGRIELRAKDCKNYPTAYAIVNSLVGSSNTDSNDQPWTVKDELGLRYQGKDPNNYMCFYSTCTSGYLYRIIGVMDDEALYGDSTLFTNRILKVVKSTYSSTSAYSAADDGGTNVWSTSTIRNTLNNTFYNTATGITYVRDKILTTKWYLMSNSTYSVTAAYMYERERNGDYYPTSPKYSFDKIGLIYGSDYHLSSYEGGSCDHSAVYSTTYASNCKGYSFLTPGANSWAITPSIGNLTNARYYRSTGASSTTTVTTSYRYNPVFHIPSNVLLSGSGTAADPYKIVS